jgi:hypothetical protein
MVNRGLARLGQIGNATLVGNAILGGAGTQALPILACDKRWVGVAAELQVI